VVDLQEIGGGGADLLCSGGGIGQRVISMLDCVSRRRPQLDEIGGMGEQLTW
jgi:hypothetical protein